MCFKLAWEYSESLAYEEFRSVSGQAVEGKDLLSFYTGCL